MNIVLCLVFLVLMGAGLATGRAGFLSTVDSHIHDWVVTYRSAGVTHFFSLITVVGSTQTIWILDSLIIIVLLLRRRRSLAFFSFLTMSGCGLSIRWIKAFIDRSRPPIADLFGDPARWASWPSGHSAATMATGGLCILLIGMWRAGKFSEVHSRQSPRRIALAAQFVLGLVIALVGVSRVVLGYHWPSDVLGGWLLGCAWLGMWVTAISMVGHYSRT